MSEHNYTTFGWRGLGFTLSEPPKNMLGELNTTTERNSTMANNRRRPSGSPRDAGSVLQGLNGKMPLSPSDALIRLHIVNEAFCIAGAHLQCDGGRDLTCTTGTGIRPVVTLLDQLAAAGGEKVFLSVTVA